MPVLPLLMPRRQPRKGQYLEVLFRNLKILQSLWYPQRMEQKQQAPFF